MHCFLIWSWYRFLELYITRDIIGLTTKEILFVLLSVHNWCIQAFHVRLIENQFSQSVVLFLSHRFKSVTLSRFCSVLLLFSVDFLGFHDHFVETWNIICWSSSEYAMFSRNSWLSISNDIVNVSSNKEYSLEELILKVQILPLIYELFWERLDILRNI